MALERAPRRRPDFRLVLITFEAVGLAALWIIFSGKLDALHLAFGAISIVVVLVMTRGLFVRLGREETSRRLAHFHPTKAIGYALWLIKEVVVANLDIARIVLTPRMPIDPVLVKFRSCLTSDLAKVALGNSITLTPGTLTLEILGQDFIVHSIAEGTATGPTIDEMQRKLAEVFGDDPPEKLRYEVERTFDGDAWRGTS